MPSLAETIFGLHFEVSQNRKKYAEAVYLARVKRLSSYLAECRTEYEKALERNDFVKAFVLAYEVATTALNLNRKSEAIVCLKYIVSKTPEEAVGRSGELFAIYEASLGMLSLNTETIDEIEKYLGKYRELLGYAVRTFSSGTEKFFSLPFSMLAICCFEAGLRIPPQKDYYNEECKRYLSINDSSLKHFRASRNVGIEEVLEPSSYHQYSVDLLTYLTGHLDETFRNFDNNKNAFAERCYLFGHCYRELRKTKKSVVLLESFLESSDRLRRIWPGDRLKNAVLDSAKELGSIKLESQYPTVETKRHFLRCKEIISDDGFVPENVPPLNIYLPLAYALFEEGDLNGSKEIYVESINYLKTLPDYKERPEEYWLYVQYIEEILVDIDRQLNRDENDLIPDNVASIIDAKYRSRKTSEMKKVPGGHPYPPTPTPDIPDELVAHFSQAYLRMVQTHRKEVVADVVRNDIGNLLEERVIQLENDQRERQIEEEWEELLNSIKSQELISSEYLGGNIGEILDRVIDEDVAYIITRKDQKLGMISKSNKTLNKVDRSISSQELARNRTLLDERRRLLITRRKKIQAVYNPAPKK